MKQENKDILLDFIGLAFLLISLYIFFMCALVNWYVGLLWVCYIGIFFIIIGIFFKKPDLIFSQLIILLIPDLIWTIDFFYRLIFENSLFFINNYFFGKTNIFKQILSLQHIITPPLALTSLILLKPKKNHKILLISLSEIIIIFLLGFIIPLKWGINCLPTPKECVLFTLPKNFPYFLTWWIVMSLFVVLSYLVLSKILFKQKGDNLLFLLKKYLKRKLS